MNEPRKDFQVHVFRPATMLFNFQRRRTIYRYKSDGTKEVVNREYVLNNRKYAKGANV